MFLLYAVAVVVSAAVVSAADKCCAPDQWEGGFGELVGAVVHHHPMLAGDHSTLSFDYTGKRAAMTVNYHAHGKTGKISFIINFNLKKMYIIYGSKCKIRDFKYAMKRCCVSGNATTLGSTYFGAGSDKLNVNSYSVSRKGKKGGYFVTLTVTKKGCIPVGEMIFAQSRRGKMFRSIGYYGITAGIKDPKVFVPPASCKKEDEETLYVQEDGEKIAEELMNFVVDKFT